MNTRLQVEHPITEMVTGRRPGAVADPHRARRAARPRSRSAADAEVRTRSSAASTRRIPTTASCPSPGRIQGLRVPQGPGVRDDSGAYEGGEVPIFYDPMISKLITWGDNRDHALQRMRRALAEYQVRGIRTTIPFFQWILEDEDFKAGRFDTSFIDRKLGKRAAAVDRCRRTKTSRRSPPRCTCSPSRSSNGAAAVRGEPLARRRPHGSVAMIFEVAIGDRVRTVGIVRKGGAAARRPRRPPARRRCAPRQRRRSCRCWCSSTAQPRAVDDRSMRRRSPAQAGRR